VENEEGRKGAEWFADGQAAIGSSPEVSAIVVPSGKNGFGVWPVFLADHPEPPSITLAPPKMAVLSRGTLDRAGAVGSSALLDGTSFQSQPLARREQADGLLQPPHLRFFLLGGIDPTDVHALVRRSKPLEEIPSDRLATDRLLNVPRNSSRRRPWGVSAATRWRELQSRGHQSSLGLELRISFAIRR
jgi:hypothetical protein